MGRVCNVCGGSDYSAPYDGVDVLRCAACGFVSRRSIPKPAELQAMYDREYSDGASFKEFYADLRLARRTEAALRIRSLGSLAPGRRMLDVGSGMGFYVDAARECGWDVEGVEISEDALAMQSDWALPIRRCAFEDFETHDRFDVITLWAFIEHAVDPRSVLDRAFELLRPGGVVVVETGDAFSRSARRDGAAWRMFGIAGHLHFFSSQCLDQALESTGFVVESTQLDKWVEHALMQGHVERSLLAANRVLPRFAVKLAARAKLRVCQQPARSDVI